MTSLDFALIYLLAAVLGVVLFRSLKLPSMLGYLIVGVIVGPHVLGMIHTSANVRWLAELGVVFLMFVIGLEFNLPRLRAMRRHVLGLGLLQVVLTMAIGTLGILALRWLMPDLWQLSWQGALALSGVLVMSSTAIVVKLLAERLEIDTEHGKRVIGVLLFQDLAVVPLLILIPSLSAHHNDMAETLLLAMLKAAAVVALLLTGGPRLMKFWLTIVARFRSEELFVLNLLLVTLGLAWVTEQAGLSLALGAFIAGMLVSETPYKQHVEAEIRPFHDLLLGLFFITIGMALDWHEVLRHWQWVLVLVTIPVAFKAAVLFGISKILGAPSGVALRTGLYLAQAGEFGFVLLNLTLKGRLIPVPLFNAILASMVLSMMATPFIIMASKSIVERLVSSEWMGESLQMTKIARQSIAQTGHVIICGYGKSGQNIARMLAAENQPYIALDINPDLVRQASSAGNSVVYGDSGKASALTAAGLARARAVAITFLNLPQTLRVLAHVRTLAPGIPVLVRTQDDQHLDALRAAGATEVVPETIEGSLTLASHALALLGVPMRHVKRTMQQQRAQRYSLLRGHFYGTDEEIDENDMEHIRLGAVTLPDACTCLGQTVSSLNPLLTQHHATLVTIRRATGAQLRPRPDMPLHAADTLVFSAKPLDLAELETTLLH